MGAALREESLATLSAVHLGAMREHHRRAALLDRPGERWEETPDWRLDRQVIRLGLYLSERAGVQRGDAIGILSPLRREWLLVDLAAAVQGVVPVALDPDLSPSELAAAATGAALRAVFVSGAAMAERLALAGFPRQREGADGRGAGLGPGPDEGSTPALQVVSFDEPGGGVALSEALDLGGTLDTAERAVAFRARAREVRPEQRALGWFARGQDGGVSAGFATHREAAARVRALWSSALPREGDVAYVAAHPVALGVRLALLAFLGDGRTTLALGTPGREAEEVAALRPHLIVADSAFIDSASGRAGAHDEAVGEGIRSWLEHALRRFPLRRRRQDGEPGAMGRARWIRSAAALSGGAPTHAGGSAVVFPRVDHTRGGEA